MANAVGPVVLIGLVILGFALFWARHMVYRHRRAAADDAVKLILSVAATLCIILGVIGGLVHSLSILAPVGLVVAAGVAIMLVTRYRAMERRSFLRCLSLAAQKGVPLNEAARAFARERSDELGIRAYRFAESIEAGLSLPNALTRSGTRLPIDALLAIRVGYETSTLSESLKRISSTDVDFDLLVRSVFEKLLYLCWIWLVLVGIATFIMLKIVPVFEKMFREFSVELPVPTQSLIDVSQLYAEYWFVLAPVKLVGVFLSCLGALYYIDLLPPGAPVVNRLRRRMDRAILLRALALAVNQQWSMAKTVWMLSRLYPVGPIRGRLYAAGNRINNGEHWCDSLGRVGLLDSAEITVLHAASRVGNLEWALEEMSDSSIRRLVYRLRLAINILFPVTLFLCGLVIAFVVISLFIPLVALIQGMT